MGRRLGSVRTDQRGIAAPVAVIVLLAIFAAATLSVDAGNLWQTRRNMITATDAAALAEAGDAALTGTPTCTGLYNTVLDNNAGEDVYDRSCTVTPGPSEGTGWVAVEGRKTSDVRFGAVIGLDDTAAYSMSAAMFGYPTAAIGLRPIAFCYLNSHVQTWADLKNGTITQEQYQDLKGSGDVNGDGLIDYPNNLEYQPYGVIHRMFFNKDVDDGQCGTFPGNWGWFSFDGLPANQIDRNNWIRKGWTGKVRIREGGEVICPGVPGSGGEAEANDGCPAGDSGALAGQNAAALDSILNTAVPISIFDAGACTGGGVSCTFETWAFVGVILRGYKVNADQSLRYFDFEFQSIQISGSCCAAFPVNQDLGARAVRLCAVDHDTQEVATRCALT